MPLNRKENKVKIINKFWAFIFIITLLVSCEKEKEIYRLNNVYDKTNFIKLIYNKDTLIISEYFENKKKDKHILLKIRNQYYDYPDLKKGIATKESYVLFSTKKYKSLIPKTFFTFPKDSIKTGNRVNNLYYTEIKANGRPVNLRYYYDKNYRIKKIVFRVGKDVYLYK
ncbi:hypothetical protein BWK63_04070 [Flavobacterium covae]|uniref:Lipoprotein n=2 Tax=Flavobacterium TaxID=237 RepID=A0AA94JQH0_9FLAO|nr:MULTISPECIES: hypothetical protein [Flavobacterium]OXA82895.1 hypothetical protein B0A56_03315 [Flavobacterium columnare NBRC 100251 = ATCC 23463]MCH4828441.1 hypothetical protein [Flavobacterium columnare]MCH4832270.1 hypothetical protein [Flavobacterium columnare]OWP81723.1 hypothetical protein BWK63_04070 [Flavobacterium covae]OWP86953.1 hypothetical protein BWK60_06185 [Flavobacterium covae]